MKTTLRCCFASVLGMVLASRLFAAASEPLATVPPTVPFLIGADISWVPQQEAEGRRYSVDGTEQDILVILREHGFNLVRLRIFNDPAATNGEAEGDQHTWAYSLIEGRPDFLNLWKYSQGRYKYLSEFGVLSPMNVESVRKCIDEDQQHPGDRRERALEPVEQEYGDAPFRADGAGDVARPGALARGGRRPGRDADREPPRLRIRGARWTGGAGGRRGPRGGPGAGGRALVQGCPRDGPAHGG